MWRGGGRGKICWNREGVDKLITLLPTASIKDSEARPMGTEQATVVA